MSSTNKVELTEVPVEEEHLVDSIQENTDKDLEIIEEKKCCYDLKEKLGDQDCQQKINMVIALVLELYRVLMGSFLMLFVPQECNGNICGLTENIGSTSLYNASFTVNAITFLSSLIMYTYEVKRENTMINYLHVNDDVPTDNDEVGKVLVRLPEEKKNKILKLDKQYQLSSYVTFVFFLVNSVLSGITISEHYLDNKTLTVFITNVLFMAGKLIDVSAITNTEINIFYSAYLKHRIQYNDVDPDKMIELMKKKEAKEAEAKEAEAEAKEAEAKEAEAKMVEETKESEKKNENKI